MVVGKRSFLDTCLSIEESMREEVVETRKEGVEAATMVETLTARVKKLEGQLKEVTEGR